MKENLYIKFNNLTLDGGFSENLVFNGCYFSGTFGKKLHFKNCQFNSCVFDSLDLDQISFEGCTFKYNQLISCKFLACKLQMSRWYKTTTKFCQWMACSLDPETITQIYGDHFSGAQELVELEECTTQWSYQF